MNYELHNGDCLEVMKSLPDCSVDAVVTDPPYFLINNSGLGFMGKEWDGTIGLWKYLWLNPRFVRTVADLFGSLPRAAQSSDAGSIAPEGANTKASENGSNGSAPSAESRSPFDAVLKNASVRLLAVTKHDLLASLSGSLGSLTRTVEESLSGVEENASFVLPILLPRSEASSTVVRTATTSLRAAGCRERRTVFTKTETLAISEAIAALSGGRYGGKYISETGGVADFAGSIADGETSSATTLHPTDLAALTKPLTLLLYALLVTRELNRIPTDLITNFFTLTFREAFRVLKPGGHVLAFAGTRTYQYLATGVENAGFEVRDQIQYIYGSGFPKSLDVSKAMDKRGGNAHLTAHIGAAIKAARIERGLSVTECDRRFCGGTTNWSWYEGRPTGQRAPTPDDFAKIAMEWPELQPLAASVAEAEREVIGKSAHKSGIGNGSAGHYTVGGTIAQTVPITAPATEAAKQWEGWGTSLKPAHEPICLARKPLTGTVAENVRTYGTGAINIDKCRISAPSTGLRPDIMEAWGDEKNLCIACANSAANPSNSGPLAARGCSAVASANMPLIERAAINPADTSKTVIGCSDGTRTANSSISLNTAEFGKMPTAQSRTASRSTTSTNNGTTTASIICNSCGSPITFHSTNGSTSPKTKNSPPAANSNGNAEPVGRWPSNVIHDGSEEVVGLFPQTTSGKPGVMRKGINDGYAYGAESRKPGTLMTGFGDSGTAARFFYCAKASKSDRNAGLEGFEAKDKPTLNAYTHPSEGRTAPKNGSPQNNFHPTVKPTELMRYLCRLITPPNGTVLDPFAGSGSTGKAAMLEGFNFIGIEREKEYAEIAKARIEHVRRKEALFA